MTAGIKAIETEYRGYRFRSRLEARWAVALDHLGVKWDYEVEGFELPSGWYLPDFWLPGLMHNGGVWLEIKGAPADDVNDQLISDLCEAQCRYGYLLCGSLNDDLEVWQIHKEGGRQHCEVDVLAYFLNCSPEDMQAALKAARGARFEHGEKGAAKQ